MMFSLAKVQRSPTQLFSTQRFWFSAVMRTRVMAFCTNIAGCGFSEWCMISRWSLTRFWIAKVEERSSWDVPKW